jgi:hypothetical protein
MPFAPDVLFVSGGHDYPELPGPLLTKPFVADDLIRMAQRIIQERWNTAARQVIQSMGGLPCRTAVGGVMASNRSR